MTLTETDRREQADYQARIGDFRYNGGRHPDDPVVWPPGPCCACGCGTMLAYRDDVTGTVTGTAIAEHQGRMK